MLFAFLFAAAAAAASPRTTCACGTEQKAATSNKSAEHSQKAKLMFAHCETLVPLASLMGLFKTGAYDCVRVRDPRDAFLSGVVARWWR